VIDFSFNGRHQKVVITSDDKYVRFRSRGAKHDIWNNSDEWWDFIPYTWGRNTQSDKVDFYFDEKGNLLGRIPQLGQFMQPKEFVYYATTLAQEMDRVEFLLEKEDRF